MSCSLAYINYNYLDKPCSKKTKLYILFEMKKKKTAEAAQKIIKNKRINSRAENTYILSNTVTGDRHRRTLGDVLLPT